jgi:hypothetical protein
MPKSMNKRKNVKNSRKLKKMKQKWRGGATLAEGSTEEEKAKLAAGGTGLLGSLTSTLNPAAMSGVMSGALESAKTLATGGKQGEAEPKPEVVSEPKPEVVSEPKPEVVSEPKPEEVSNASTMTGGRYKSKRRKNKMNYKKKSKKH